MHLKEYIINNKTYIKSYDFYMVIGSSLENYTQWCENVIIKRGVYGVDYIVDYEDGNRFDSLQRKRLRLLITPIFAIMLTGTTNKPNYKKAFAYLSKKYYGRN